MFGYVKVYKPELKMKEFEMYKGVYCSLCKQLGKSYGPFARLLLNYDITFLALLLQASQTDESEYKKSHCTFCFAKKCVCCALPDDTLEYAAAMTIIMTYHKILDNIHDGTFSKKLVSALVLPYFKAKHKKASKLYPEISSQISEQMQKQTTFEESKSASVDLAADASAKALGNIISYRFPKEEKNTVYRFGYFLGRFVYICDALADLEEDFKDNNYNVFLINNRPDFESIRENAYSILDITADEMARTYELLNLKRYKSILDNIIYYGLDCTMDKVLKRKEEINEKSV